MTWLWLGVPLLFIALGAHLLRRALRARHWTRTRGVVVREVFWVNGNYPEVEFTTADGAVHTFRDKVGQTRFGGRTVSNSIAIGMTPGSAVTVAYDPAAPDEAVIVRPTLWLLPVALLGLGVVFLALLLLNLVLAEILGA